MSGSLSSKIDRINEALRATREQFPGAELEDVRFGDDGFDLATSDVQLRRVKGSTLGRMKEAAIAESGRIEIAQVRLVEAGRIEAPSEQMLCRRDDFDAIVRLIELIQSDDILTNRMRELNRK